MRLDIVERIHEAAERNGEWYYGYLNRFEDGKFKETTYFDEELAKPGVDLYFSPGLFKYGGSRTNLDLVSYNVFWADLDRGTSWFHVDEIPPTIIWETSPGNKQAVWISVDGAGSYDEWARINKALTYYMEADRGGWHGSKLLRIPGTPNWKYWDPNVGSTYLGKQVEETNRVYGLNELVHKLTPSIARQGALTVKDMPEPWSVGKWAAEFANHWEKMPISIRAMFEKKTITDRSAFIWTLVTHMLTAGYHKEVVFRLIEGAHFNKYRDRPEYLWNTILKAAE